MRVERATNEAFERFLLAEHHKLVALALAWSGDRETARDLAQEAPARAYRHWSMVGLLDLPGAWVRRAMINLLIDDRRDAERRRQIADRAAGGRAIAINTAASGLFVARDDGTTVLLGARDPDADLVAIAESPVEVDQASWDGASVHSIDRDGCLT